MKKLFNPDFFGAFDRLEQKSKTTNIVAFDSEDDTYGKPLSFAFYDGGRILKSGFFYTTSAEEAVSFIYRYPVESFFVSHNLEYDLGNLFKFCDFLYVDEIVKAPLMLQATLIGTRHILMNSLSYFKGSVKQMGQLVGVKKLEGEKRSQLNPDYVITDAKIVYIYMEAFQRRLVQDFGVPLSLSIGSIAMTTFRTRFMDGNAQATYNNPLLVERGYYGGRVEVFHRGVTGEGEEVEVCDINSSYPNVMKNYEYPDTNFLEASRLKTHKFGVGHFKVRVPEDIFLPCLPLKSKSGRLFFPVGEFEGYFTYAEIRKAMEQGATVLKEMDGVGTNATAKPFVEFVDFFYNQRQKCKARLKANPNDLEAKMEAELLKNIMNNLYGKFCQHKAKSNLSRRPLPDSKVYERLGEYDEKKLGDFWEYIQKESHPPKTANFLWGIHVTAYARLELLRHMENVRRAGGRLLYCDTDSIMFVGKGAIKSLLISDNLGDLSHECYDKGIFRQAKGYLLCDFLSSNLATKQLEAHIQKVACKGVQTTHAYEFIVEGAATSIKPMRFKEALVRLSASKNKGKLLENVGFNIWRDVAKSMRAIDVKRTGGMGETFPVKASDIEALEENATQTAEDWTPFIKSSNMWREAKEDFFRGVKVPEDWFKESGFPEEMEKVDGGNVPKRFFIRKTDLKAVSPGSMWFSGIVERVAEVRDRKYFEITLGAYFGEFLTHRHIRGFLPVDSLKILDINEKKLSGKKIVVTKDDDDELQIEVFNQKEKKVKLLPIPVLSEAEQKNKLIEFLTKRGKVLETAKKSVDIKIFTK